MKIQVSSPVANIRVDCEPQDAEMAVGLAKQLLMETLPAVERLGVANANFKLGFPTPAAIAYSPVEGTPPTDGIVDAQNSHEASRNEQKKKRSAGSGGKSTNWQIVDLSLSDEQMQELRAFFLEKQPKGQNHEVAVVAHKLKELLKRDSFDGHEIHTALGIVGRKTPASLSAVFNNMKLLKQADAKDKRLIVNFFTDNLVKHELPTKSASAA